VLVPMTKVAIVGHKRGFDATLDALQRLSLLHVCDFTAAPELRVSPMSLDEDRAEELEELRIARTRLDAVQHLTQDVSEVSTEPPGPGFEDAGDALAKLEAVLPEIERLAQRIGALEEEAPALTRHLESLRRLQPLASHVVELERYETVALLLDRQHAEALAALFEELEEMLDGRCEMTSGVVDPDTIGAVLVFPRAQSDAVHAMLGRGRVSRVRLPSAFEGLGFRKSLERMEQRLHEIPDELAEAREELAAAVRGSLDWEAAREAIVVRIEQLELVAQLGGTEHCFAIVGWLPEAEVGRLEAALGEGVGTEIVVDVLEPTKGEAPPVLMDNPKPARPFQRLVQLFGWPQAGSVDPTGLMSVFMPLFFGIMLGDIGYGLLLLGGAYYAYRRFEPGSMTRDLSRVMMLGAGWAVVWGILFGEVFGDLGERWLHLHPIWISRTEASAVKPLLIFAVAVGGVHITLGLLLGTWSAIRAKRHNQLAERLGQLAAIAALFTLAGVAAELLPGGLLTPSVVLLVVGMVVVGSAHGMMGLLMGPLEVIGTLGNVLSYLRLAAIGLASVYLARVANELAAMAPAVLGAIVAVLLHALNLALGAFSPTIQALRLHYVEFFSKFYDAGGTAYQPFGGSRRAEA
jgi:V/A-type H+-transporting ATPase subunit I